jgi:AcrR family transcriptional regulator
VATRRRRSDGERSRAAILGAATGLATTEGLGGLSIARLADAVGMSKSGLFAHFGSKEELQLATVDAAYDVFRSHVTGPADATPDGLARLEVLVDRYLRYIAEDVFPGGCFFASVLSEMDMRPGPIRDRLVAFLDEWLGRVEAAVRAAQAEGTIDPAEDAGQLTFEIEAAILLANAQHVVTRDSRPIERARRMIEQRLAAAR